MRCQWSVTNTCVHAHWGKNTTQRESRCLRRRIFVKIFVSTQECSFGFLPVAAAYGGVSGTPSGICSFHPAALSCDSTSPLSLLYFSQGQCRHKIVQSVQGMRLEEEKQTNPKELSCCTFRQSRLSQWQNVALTFAHSYCIDQKPTQSTLIEFTPEVNIEIPNLNHLKAFIIIALFISFPAFCHSFALSVFCMFCFRTSGSGGRASMAAHLRLVPNQA